ncbi:MAG: chorismate synthase [Phycisphaerales bacterium]|nr:chorismate synthase [Phycisphaerales bacterium]
MTHLTCQTAGESHGPCGIAMLNGLPAGLELDEHFINAELKRRQGGYGRGGRMRIETDAVTWLSGVRLGRTMGSPLVLQVPNKDSRLDDLERTPRIHRPRPGHADLSGAIKWLTDDCRDTLERASARETAARTAGGAVARCLLRSFGIEIFGFVRGMLDVVSDVQVDAANVDAMRERRDASDVYCPDEAASESIRAHIRKAKETKDTVGGLCEVHVFGCPIGLGSCMHWDDKLDSRLAAAVMGIQAFKSVEIGMGKDVAFHVGSQVHDAIEFDPALRSEPCVGFTRPRNNAGGLEGGMTDGMPVVVRGAMKPISTLLQGMPSVNLQTKEAERSDYERSDVCALSAASVVMENVVGFEVARAFLEKFGGDTMAEVEASYRSYLELAREL